mmetsp:Transcript_78730/g.210189  ORF Transcript_78730/g.210189 Transcript_78730/m.210189 type:complete len:225 (+) Transcript_78730:19-693(+)
MARLSCMEEACTNDAKYYYLAPCQHLFCARHMRGYLAHSTPQCPLCAAAMEETQVEEVATDTAEFPLYQLCALPLTEAVSRCEQALVFWDDQARSRGELARLRVEDKEAQVQRLTDELDSAHRMAEEDHCSAEAEISSLRAEVLRLTTENDKIRYGRESERRRSTWRSHRLALAASPNPRRTSPACGSLASMIRRGPGCSASPQACKRARMEIPEPSRMRLRNR